MIIRYNNPNGTHGYETIDFRETMPAAGNETVRAFQTFPHVELKRSAVLRVRR